MVGQMYLFSGSESVTFVTSYPPGFYFVYAGWQPWQGIIKTGAGLTLNSF
jgi:hypothetical protein